MNCQHYGFWKYKGIIVRSGKTYAIVQCQKCGQFETNLDFAVQEARKVISDIKCVRCLQPSTHYCCFVHWCDDCYEAHSKRGSHWRSWKKEDERVLVNGEWKKVSLKPQ